MQEPVNITAKKNYTTPSEKRRGYKHTQLGWIPKEWEVKSLDELLKIGNGRDYKHLSEGNIPVYGTGGIMRYVNDYLFDGESVGIGRKGTIDKPVYLKGKFWTVDTLFYCHSFKNSIAIYIYYLFLTINWRKYNEASGVPSLSQNTIKKIRVALPPLPEQQKIAAILSTWDRAIAQQQQLIAAKQQFKKGLMQRLLTGKQRFEGFEGEWEEVRLGDYCKMYSGGTPSRAIKEYYEGDIPWIKSGELNQGLIETVEETISELALKNSSAKIVEKGSLLLALYGATAGVVAITAVKGAINQAILAIESNEFLDKTYLFYLLKIKMPRYLKNLVQGGQPNLNGGMIKRLQIKIPLIKEQQKIASVLRAADQELGLLQKQLTQLQTQKRGLMQGLLTGAVRVKI